MLNALLVLIGFAYLGYLVLFAIFKHIFRL